MSKVIREPSIHITQARFKEILHAEMLVDWPAAKEGKIRLDIDDLVKRVFVRAHKHSLTNRVLLATTQKNRKVASKLIQSTLEDARLFTKVLLWTRRSLHHRGVIQIKEDSKDWLLIKQITELALAFVADSDLPKEQGFQEYIKLALSKMGFFALTRFPSLHESICTDYSAKQKLLEDPHPEKTKEAARYYSSIIARKTGEGPNYDKMPEKLQYFMQVVDEAKAMGISVRVFIDAQFDAFNWKEGVPHIAHMNGEKARERTLTYMYQNNIKAHEKTKKAIDFSKILDRNANRDK